MSIAAVFITVMYFKNRYVRVCANSEDIARNDDATLRETGATENDMNTQEKIIKVLKENEELTPEQISKYLGVPLRTVQYHIKKIKEVNNEL
jgi:predicted transcriptional regulator